MRDFPHDCGTVETYVSRLTMQSSYDVFSRHVVFVVLFLLLFYCFLLFSYFHPSFFLIFKVLVYSYFFTQLCWTRHVFFGVRSWLGTILVRFSIIYFMGFGLRIRVRVSVVLWSG